MKRAFFVLALSAAILNLSGVELPIKATPQGKVERFTTTPKKGDGITCVKLEDGKCVVKMDGTQEMKKLLSSTRLKIAQGDKLKITVKAKGKGNISYGIYVYDSNKPNKFIGAVYKNDQAVTETSADYVYEGVVEKNAKEKSSFDRPAFGLFFFLTKKGAVVEVEKIEYEIKKAPEEKVALPDF